MWPDFASSSKRRSFGLEHSDHEFPMVAKCVKMTNASKEEEDHAVAAERRLKITSRSLSTPEVHLARQPRNECAFHAAFSV